MRRIRSIPNTITEFQTSPAEGQSSPETSDRITKTYSFELITPMFGGDSTSWQINEKAPVRSQSIKGQLRFWWRTMQHETDVKHLLYRENTLWGGKFKDSDEANRKKSKVSISVINQKVEKSQKAQMESKYAVRGDVIPKYVLFPITDKVKNGDHIVFIIKLTFDLGITYPKAQEAEVLKTLQLWTLFGGVGARTRRGTGSLYCKELLEKFKDIHDIKKFLDELNDARISTAYPSFNKFYLAASNSWTELPANKWHALLDNYGKFRQDRAPGQGNRPGRSYWPEPDAIRSITKQFTIHKPRHPDKIWFPRAAFGLPILSRFQNMDRQGDPSGDFHLEPNIGTGERLPSPMILKVVKLSRSQGYSICLALGQKFPDTLVLKYGKASHTVTQGELPTHTQGKIMNMNTPARLSGIRDIYKTLATHLGLTEVK
ncbi:type III-B CRISPR module RAMP protein Cmr1 [Deltaproteobacteria bacterium TL4]